MRVPVLTLTIIATVGLGIGATAAIFSAVNAAMLRPLPYADPIASSASTPTRRRSSSASPSADYLAFTEQQTRFEQHATYTDRSVSFSNGEVAELLRTRVVSWAFFSVLGISPLLGRDFTEADGRPGTRQWRSPATRSGSSVWAAAPTRSASPFASTAPTTRDRRDAAGRWPARSPLRSVPDSAVHAAAAQGPVLLLGDRAAARQAPIASWPPASCARSIARCSRSGSRRTRTRSRRGAWRISRPTWSATCARSPASRSRRSGWCG